MTDRDPAVIFDIDGTLADCEHRRHHLAKTPKDWYAFFKAMPLDLPKPMAISMVQDFAKRGYQPIFLTGRPAEWRHETVDWLMMHVGMLNPTLLFMRPFKDFLPDHEIKMQIYREKIAPKFKVELVLEDRSNMVKVWRGLGLECWQVADGEF